MTRVAGGAMMIGGGSGSVMCQKRGVAGARSTRAASWRSSGIACNPASSMMAKKGTPRQTLVAMTAGIARPGSLSQATRSRSRSEEHTSELQSRSDLVCRLLLEKKKNNHYIWCARRWHVHTHLIH